MSEEKKEATAEAVAVGAVDIQAYLELLAEREDFDELHAWLRTATDRVARLETALEKIAAPRRPDGTYNLDREACEKLAREALR